MGNNLHQWYIKGSGNSWADTKCSLDDCYFNIFDPEKDANLFFQADIPNGVWVQEVWLCDMEGNRLQDLLPITDWKTIYSDTLRRIIFHMPQDSFACVTQPEDGCFVDFFNDQVQAAQLEVIEWWQAGTNEATLAIIHLGVVYPLGLYDSNAPLPAGWTWIDAHTISLPCGVNYPSIGTNYSTTSTTGGYNTTFGNNLQQGDVPGTTALKCWYLEIPLLDVVTGEEAAVLASEPYKCPDCINTVSIYGDYCLSKTDVNGELIFNTDGLTGDIYGGLTTARNDMRINAVLKQLPGLATFTRNVKCNTFKSSLQKRYRLQGAMPVDFPPYAAEMIQSALAAKKVYIDGEQYIPNSEQFFTERNVPGRSAYKLDMELIKCPNTIVFDCSCTPPPVDCEVNPVVYEGGVEVTNLPFTAYGEANSILDDSYVWTAIDPMAISGGTPPYTISNWHTGAAHIVPNNDIEVFDDNREWNIWRRINTPDKMQALQESVLVDITDANGCKITTGVTVSNVLKDMRCAGLGASFTYGSITSTSVQINSITTEFGLNAFDCFDVSKDAETTGYQYTGITTLPYVVTGLNPATDYQIVVRVWCECPADPNAPSGETSGQIGPAHITTLP